MKHKETEILELKKSTSELKEAVISIVAILNKHQLGELYFGIRNDGVTVGQTVSDKILIEIANTISQNIEPKIYPEINKIIIKNKDCIYIKFKGDGSLYYAFGRVYKRVGTSNKQLSPKELENIILQMNKDKLYWDNQLSAYSVKDINAKLLKSYIRIAQKEKRINFNYKDVETTLKKLELIKNNKLIQAVEVLFMNKNVLELQCAIFAGTNKVKFLDIKTFTGNIFHLMEEAELYISQRINWEVEIKKLERDEIPEIPIAAIREAIINSFCHRDFFLPENNEIAVFKDRVEIYNPGTFPEGHEPEDYIEGEERSVLRNPVLAQILYYSRDIERFGSGLKRIYDECKVKKVKVEFKKFKRGFLVVFYRKKSVVTKINGGVNGGVNLLYEYIKNNPGLRVNHFYKALKISVRTIERYIARLRQEEKIIFKGSPKTGGYVITKNEKK